MISFKSEKLIVLGFLSLLILNLVSAGDGTGGRELTEEEKRAEQVRYNNMSPAEREAEEKRKAETLALKQRLKIHDYVHPCNQYTLPEKYGTGND